MSKKNKRVAILGASFRLPGTTQERFWSDLLAGRNLVSRVGIDRWEFEPYWHPAKNHPGTSYTFAAGSLGDVFGFDAAFFGISPREAAQMDPQQRLLLELSWEALENAGIRPSDVRGRPCGVYIGISSTDYSFRFADDLAAIDSATATGSTASIAANRISYAFDLRGPSVAIDTACSSSLVAFHLACRSITSGESELALAGGVSLHLHPYAFVAFSKASMLSKQGACRVFDAAADGYVRSEGGGVFVLKDYDRALADGDPILAVVASSAVNTDGRKSGLTVPSIEAQIALMAQACSDAGVAPADIDYVEAHGTGTPVGDPVETRAIGEALGRRRSRDNPLLIGSIKSNVGHLEAASGVAGLIKALYCIRHRMVPATIHLENPNPNIRFEEWNIRVATEPVPLKPQGKIYIGVNSFGFGGANAHVLLESHEEDRRSQHPAQFCGALLPFVISGKTPAALKAAAGSLASFLRNQDGASLYDIAWTTIHRREWHDERAIAFASDAGALAAMLEQFAGGASAVTGMETGTALPSPVRVAFIYSGNGSQWEGMGRRLLGEEPVFRDAVRAVDAVFGSYAGYSLEDELLGRNGSGRYEFTEIAQPALFAVQVGLTQLLRHWGITPAAVAGHSVGEIAAAWACGALSLDQAVHVIFHRSRLQATTKGRGGMTAVGLGEAAAQRLIDHLGLAACLSLAGINGPSSVTVAGEVTALDALEKALRAQGVAHKRLELDYAFHSPAMDAIEPDIRQALADLRPGKALIPFYSTVTGTCLEAELLGADYWWRNIREPVQFAEALSCAHSQGVNLFVEIGPHALLRGYINSLLAGAQTPGQVVATMLRGDDGPERLRAALCRLAIAGATVDWKPWLAQRGRFVTLPNYPWQRERYCHTVTAESYRRLNRRREHPLLGFRLHENEWSWENHIDLTLNPTLADHVIGEAAVMPGTGYAEMALAAARLWQREPLVEIEQMEIRSPLVLSTTRSKVLRFDLDISDGSFTIRSRDHLANDNWTVHATGRIPGEPHDVLIRQEPLVLPTRNPDFSGEDHDALARTVGLAYGPAFRALDAVWLEDGTACARLRLPQEIEPEITSMHLHPALLDCTFQLIIQLLKDDYLSRSGTIYVPVKIDRLVCRCGAVPRMAQARLIRVSPHSLTADFTLYDGSGTPVAWIPQARFQNICLNQNPADRLKYLEYHIVPQPHPLRPAVSLLDFERIEKSLADLVQSLSKRSALKLYAGEIEPLLDELCCRFAARALRALAANGHTLTQADVQACVDASPETAPLLTYLIAMLEKDGMIEAIDGEWRFAAGAEDPTAEDIWRGLLMEHPDCVAVLHGVGRIGMHLPSILQGALALEQVLPRDCTLSRMTLQVLTPTGLAAMREVMQNLVHRTLAVLPPGQRFRIVEMGADFPSFAIALCRTIDFDRCDYLFASTTDIRASEECNSLRERYPKVQFQQLDPGIAADAPPIPPGEQFHLALVISDFATEQEALLALAHARRLLAPGGTLLFIEQPRARWLDFLFGGRRSWWSEATDEDGPSRLKPARFWRRQMAKLGFSDSIVISAPDNAASGPSLILARQATSTDIATGPAPAQDRTWVLLADPDGSSAPFTAKLAARLEARGDRVIHVSPGNRLTAVGEYRYLLAFHEAAQFEALLSRLTGLYGPLAGILHLYGFEPSPGDTPSLLLFDRQVDRCAAAAAVSRACENTRTTTRLWLVTARGTADRLPLRDRQAQSPHSGNKMDAALWGFGRTLMNEASGIDVRLVDIEDSGTSDAVIYALVREITHPDAEQEILLTASGNRYVPRLRTEPPSARAEDTQDSPTARLEIPIPGQLRNLRWEAHRCTPPAEDELEIEVRATGLNFRDVMYALGLLSGEAVESGFAGATLGLEFAGVVSAVGERVKGFAPGDRVVGFGPSSFGNRVLAKAGNVSLIPSRLSFESAATIPSAFFTACYAINHLARLEEGESILIHGAAGGVGIAAIQLAKWCGAEIFATAGTEEKRDFLRLLGVEHVFDSRSLAFADEILTATNGRGVDVVLNSLSGEAINRNLRVLKPFGRFVELGKRDFQENTRIGLRPFRNNISYFAVDADQLMKERPQLTARVFREVMTLIDKRMLHPLPYIRFQAEEIIDAFRYMQQSRHIGKIVVTYRNGIHPVHPPRAQKRRLKLQADTTWLVTGGLSGFGLKTAQWLAAKGACNLVLVNRSGSLTPEAETAVRSLREGGVRIHTAACDVCDRRALAKLLAWIETSLPPLRGIVHAAAVIEDSLIRNMSPNQIRRVLAPKILGAYNLHQMTLGQGLDFFVLFSSATTLFGNPGQGNYVAANCALEALAAARRAAGLPALCVGWGAIDDTGYLARNPQIKEAIEGRMGGSAICSDVALDVLEELLLTNRSGLGVLDLGWTALARFLPSAGSPKFGELLLGADEHDVDKEPGLDTRQLLANLSRAELAAALVPMLKKEVGEILRISPEKIDENRSLYDMGFDSLMSVELATAVEARFSVKLPVMALSENPTIVRLSERIAAQLNETGHPEEQADASLVAERAREIAARHADEEHAEAIARAAAELQSSREPEKAGRMIH